MSWHLVSHKKAIFQVDFLLPFLLAIPNWMQATERNRDQILCAVVAHKICKSRAAWCFSEISFQYTNRSMTSEAAAKLTEKLVTAAQGNTSEWAQHKSDSLSLELSSRVFALFGIALHTHCSDLQVKWHSWWRNQFRVSFFCRKKCPINYNMMELEICSHIEMLCPRGSAPTSETRQIIKMRLFIIPHFDFIFRLQRDDVRTSQIVQRITSHFVGEWKPAGACRRHDNN